jgi:mannitol-1-/sugar-/sorbitol-6-/2-deoxyglucose-6-phosphatase
MTTPFAPRALILDMDGLLVDSEPLWFEVERAFARERGADFTLADAHACVGRGMAHTVLWMGETFGFDVDVERDTRALLEAFVARVGELELKPGATTLLDRAAGAVPLALASSSARRLIGAVLDRFDLTRRFAVVISGEEVARPKPAPDIFLSAAGALGVPSAACAVLEDSLPGATAGRAAGMFVVAVPEGPWEGRGFEAVADAIVPDLTAAAVLLGLLGPAPVQT